MALYVKSLREQVRDLREENSEMQREINLLVKQRDTAMDKLPCAEDLYFNSSNVLYSEGYHYCGGRWKKGVDKECVCIFKWVIIRLSLYFSSHLNKCPSQNLFFENALFNQRGNTSLVLNVIKYMNTKLDWDFTTNLIAKKKGWH